MKPLKISNTVYLISEESKKNKLKEVLKKFEKIFEIESIPNELIDDNDSFISSKHMIVLLNKSLTDASIEQKKQIQDLLSIVRSIRGDDQAIADEIFQSFDENGKLNIDKLNKRLNTTLSEDSIKTFEEKLTDYYNTNKDLLNELYINKCFEVVNDDISKDYKDWTQKYLQTMNELNLKDSFNKQIIFFIIESKNDTDKKIWKYLNLLLM